MDQVIWRISCQKGFFSLFFVSSVLILAVVSLRWKPETLDKNFLLSSEKAPFHIEAKNVGLSTKFIVVML